MKKNVDGVMLELCSKLPRGQKINDDDIKTALDGLDVEKIHLNGRKHIIRYDGAGDS